MKRPAIALAVTTLLVAAVMSSCSRGGARNPVWQKLVILGFDGMDPDLVERWVGEGKLPNIKRLMNEGGLYPLDDDPFGGVADGVGLVRDRGESGQAQHLRLPRSRHDHLPA